MAEVIVPHAPSHCAACNQPLNSTDPKPYMGHYVLELEKGKSGFGVVCQCHAVIARRIGYGTRTSEGSLAYSSGFECD